jgi:predicted  nucleic acid-binding Zn-ribbon protein
MTRDNEDRIVVLQNRVDDMTNQVNKQKRELLEYKSKEANSLEQISMVKKMVWWRGKYSRLHTFY